MTRIARVLVTRPNVVLVVEELGLPRFTWLNTLNASRRIWTDGLFVPNHPISKFFSSDTSELK